MQLLPHSFDLMTLVYGILSGIAALFFAYTVKPGEVFGAYGTWLAKRRLKRTKHIDFNQYKRMEKDNLDKIGVHKLIFQAAEDYFTFEKAIGMCAICTGFWICLISGIFYRLSPVPIVEIILIGHATIIMLKKFYD